MRKALELSTTHAPDATACAAHDLEIPLPAEKNAMPTSAKQPGLRASTTTEFPPTEIDRPADLSLAKSLTLSAETPFEPSNLINSAPTAPVAPTTAIVKLFDFTKLFTRNQPLHLSS